MFSEEFLSNLPTEPINALYKICEEFFNQYYLFSESDTSIQEAYNTFIEAYATLQSVCEIYRYELDFQVLSGNAHNDIENIIEVKFREIFDAVSRKKVNNDIENIKEKVKIHVGNVFRYEFTDGDLTRLQDLINELRNEINQSEIFNANHKERLLKKLESLQSELHKKMSSIDKFWAFTGEAGIVLGKFGNDAKPFVDRIKEILKITWATQARAEQLPSGTSLPFLKTDD